MKKLFLLLFVIVSFSVHAQFKASKDGFIVEEGDKDYYVEEIPDLTASQLYTAISKYIVSNYENPDKVMHGVKDETISLNTFHTNIFTLKSGLVKLPVNIKLSLVIHFKDGKMRFDKPIVDRMYMQRGDNPRDIVFSGGVGFAGQGDISLFDKKGEMKNVDGVKGLNSFINKFINEIINQAQNMGTSDNDW